LYWRTFIPSFSNPTREASVQALLHVSSVCRCLAKVGDAYAAARGNTQTSGARMTIAFSAATPSSAGFTPRSSRASPGGCGSCKTEPAPPPNPGVAGTLEEAKAGFKTRYEQVKVARERRE
jgi:hypothetical protein